MNKSKTISVIGAGTAGCFTVMYLAKKYPDNKITWVVKSLTDNIGVGEATVPVVQEFLTDLGYNTEYILRNCNGSLKVGIQFKNFAANEFWHPFGNSKKEQIDILYMARKKRIPEWIFEYGDLATHFDVNVIIKDFYEKLVTFDNVDIVEEVRECDINIRCTGFEKEVSNNFTSADKLLNKQAIIHRSKYTDINDKVPYTVCTAAEYGWIWKISLGNNVTYGYVNDGNGECYNEFIKFLESQNIIIDYDTIKTINFNCGRKNIHLTNNTTVDCYIGLSSCFLEPLESTGLYFIVHAIKTLGAYLDGLIDVEEYNNIINSDFDTVYNFIIAHYTGSENMNYYWTKCRSHEFIKTTNNLFPSSSWDYILNGLSKGTEDRLPVERFKDLATGTPYHVWSDQYIT